MAAHPLLISSSMEDSAKEGAESDDEDGDLTQALKKSKTEASGSGPTSGAAAPSSSSPAPAKPKEDENATPNPEEVYSIVGDAGQVQLSKDREGCEYIIQLLTGERWMLPPNEFQNQIFV